MITLHHFFVDEQAAHDSFVNKWARKGREDWTDEQMEKLWEAHIKIGLELEDIFDCVENPIGGGTNIYCSWNTKQPYVVKESKEEIQAMIDAEEAKIQAMIEIEEAEIKAANEERKLNLLNEIFDFFLNNIGLYDGGPNYEENDRKFFIETFKDKL